MICSNCHQPTKDPDAVFCASCGQRLCQENCCAVCGKSYQPDAKFCSQCGTPVGSTSTRSWNTRYCEESGSAILPDDEHFRCKSCTGLYLEKYRIEGQPLCIHCAERKEPSDHPLIQENDSDNQLEAAVQDEISRRIAEAEQAWRKEAQQNQPSLEISNEDWVLVHGGEYSMGSSRDELDRFDSEQQHQVKINTFEILKTPITFAMYDAYCDAQSLDKPNDESWGRDNRPVINITYWDTVEYARWLKRNTGWHLRLPTEAEWEYACRAGTATPFWTGETISTDQANFNGIYPYGDSPKGISRSMTTPVDQFEPSPLGLYDMHGNVWEWCASEYDDIYNGQERLNASGDSDNLNPRVVRGGSWYNLPSSLRSASRNKLSPNLHFLKVGFRLVREIS
ncbi:MAG: SUMF1/EgtB/PvdO family nonheme iron enzyme [Gammaproteobacteria bacterium]|nr:SUMF1/EgtB/PvdO family nonheme iron enzyme [Gammaproteobacteria bacterium]